MIPPSGPYAFVGEILRTYWRSYGGVSALIRSPYLHLALLLTALLYPAWHREEWWNDVLAVLPNIVGFSIGGYAIWLGFGDEKFKALMAEPREGEVSPYMELSATFCHFVLVQLVAIGAALFGNALHFDGSQLSTLQWFAGLFGKQWIDFAPAFALVGGFLGYFLFVYALATALAAVLAIFQVATWFDAYRTVTALKEKSPAARLGGAPLAPRMQSADATGQQDGERKSADAS